MEISSAKDITTVITAHNAWKRNIMSVIDNTATQEFNAETVAQDNLCVLGKWIYGSNSENYIETDEFQELKTLHTRFHELAAGALVLAQDGKKDDARNIIQSGEYPELSRKITALLTSLYRQSK